MEQIREHVRAKWWCKWRNQNCKKESKENVRIKGIPAKIKNVFGKLIYKFNMASKIIGKLEDRSVQTFQTKMQKWREKKEYSNQEKISKVSYT